MAKVLGVGGVFYRAPDAAAMREWYTRVLGFELESWGGVMFPPLTMGVTVWSPFKADSTYFAPSEREMMINFVVDDLDGMLARAAAEGVPSLGGMDEDNGRFAWVMDPWGWKVELWQPKANAAE